MYRERKVTFSLRLLALGIGVICALLFLPYHNWIWGMVTAEPQPTAQTYDAMTDPSGTGSAYPPYWSTQDYWVAEGCPVSNEVKAEAEKLLAPLDADNISKTAIVCMPAGSVSNPGEWAKRFGRYYQLGNADGERKDNGFVWLILYDESGKTEVHMSIGDGLNKMSPFELGNVMRAAEASYDPSLSQTENTAKAIMTITSGYTEMARVNYEPWNPTEPQYGGPIDTSGSDDEAGSMLCLGLLALFVWLVLASEPVLAFFVVLLGSYGAWEMMAWPVHVLNAVASAKSGSRGSSSNNGRSSSSGKSLGGGGGFTRTR